MIEFEVVCAAVNDDGFVEFEYLAADGRTTLVSGIYTNMEKPPFVCDRKYTIKIVAGEAIVADAYIQHATCIFAGGDAVDFEYNSDDADTTIWTPQFEQFVVGNKYTIAITAVAES